MEQKKAYMLAFLIVIAVSMTGSFFTKADSEWYKCIKPKKITPPKIVFPIVWTTLYIFIAIALARTLINNNRYLLKVFAINLFLNMLWCYTYFVMHSVEFSLVVLALLWMSTYVLLWNFNKDRDIVSRNLILPYLMWLSYAFLLNVFSLEKEKMCRGISF